MNRLIVHITWLGLVIVFLAGCYASTRIQEERPDSSDGGPSGSSLSECTFSLYGPPIRITSVINERSVNRMLWTDDRLALTFVDRGAEAIFLVMCEPVDDGGLECSSAVEIASVQGIPSSHSLSWNGEAFGFCVQHRLEDGRWRPRFRKLDRDGVRVGSDQPLGEAMDECMDMVWTGERYVVALSPFIWGILARYEFIENDGSRASDSLDIDGTWLSRSSLFAGGTTIAAIERFDRDTCDPSQPQWGFCEPFSHFYRVDDGPFGLAPREGAEIVHRNGMAPSSDESSFGVLTLENFQVLEQHYSDGTFSIGPHWDLMLSSLDAESLTLQHGTRLAHAGDWRTESAAITTIEGGYLAMWVAGNEFDPGTIIINRLNITRRGEAFDVLSRERLEIEEVRPVWWALVAQGAEAYVGYTLNASPANERQLFVQRLSCLGGD